MYIKRETEKRNIFDYFFKKGLFKSFSGQNKVNSSIWYSCQEMYFHMKRLSQRRVGIF